MIEHLEPVVIEHLAGLIVFEREAERLFDKLKSGDESAQWRDRRALSRTATKVLRDRCAAR